jgi:hypothetical protein
MGIPEERLRALSDEQIAYLAPAAKKLGLRAIGIDSDSGSVQTTMQRLRATSHE